MPEKPPNILYLHCHDAGRSIEPYGYPVATPRLQDLADGGVAFRQAFSAAPTCSPSRASLLTGQYPHRTGMLGLAHRGFRLTDYSRHILSHLRAGGYGSALAGVQHIAAPPAAHLSDIGYDQILTERTDFESVTRSVIDFLAADHSRPFFLSVGFSAPHRAGESFDHITPPPEADRVRPPAILPDTAETRADMAKFLASVESLDQSAGAILTALEHYSLAEDTMVIATTDHGMPFPGMKCNLTDHGIGVFLILRYPRLPELSGGRVIDTMVSQLDLFPTISEVAGIDPPADLDGASLLPLLRGEVDRLHEELFAEVSYHAAYEPMRAVRTERWKYIRRYDGRSSPVLPNCDDSPSKRVLYDHGWGSRGPDAEQLFDLALDPAERNNLADDPGYASVRDDLRGRLARFMADSADPLTDEGLLPAPEGARITDPDDYSPSGGWPDYIRR